ncbi:adhesion G protein-coupled receptor E1 isoform X2 [Microcaecilia unicolor]|uniref:Adhesion G protein-coupled receptor E1 isoform X2 n=1 Tax=Microcaecilia unicolor TaxID=1415580 RepID=A0A6P7XBM4_9AMPH|nr:adhesion G protein-coupled receptor E1 isoform X2 [Microcaecilia unicolor]
MGKTHISLLLGIFFLGLPCIRQCYSSHGTGVTNGPGRTDINECIPPTLVDCGLNAECKNTIGSYHCICLQGYQTTSGEKEFQNKTETTCEDVNECNFSDACPKNSRCTNTIGSYYCQCKDGYRSTSGSHFTKGAARCEKDGSKCQSNNGTKECTNSSHKPVNYAFSSLMKDINDLKNTTLEEAMESFGNVLNKTALWHNLTTEKISITATSFFEAVERIALTLISGSQSVITEQMELQSKVLEANESCDVTSDPLSLNAKGDQMKIHCSTIIGDKTQGSAGAAFASYTDMEKFLTADFFDAERTEPGKKIQAIQINSRVVTGMINSKQRTDFTHPVNFTLQLIQEKGCTGKTICVFWDGSIGNGSWSTEGCETLHSNLTYTECSCYHLSSFAVLMATEESEDAPILWIITCIGIVFSLVCLCLAILTFLLCRPIRNASTSNHLQLSLCLFMGQFLFLVGIHKTFIKILCAIIAGFLHYFFLAAFSWMFLEALMLFLTVRNLKVVNYFNTRNIKMLHLCLFGYGFPALIVMISAAVNPSGYGTEKHCWLCTESNMIWSFLAPVCVFILINSILFATTLWILRAKLSTVNADVSTLKDTRLLTFKAIAQLFILGCTWIFGLFQIGSIAEVMSYLFTIINSLQGAFIFLIHCVLNRQVRQEYRRWLKSIQTLPTESQASMTITKTTDTSTEMKEKKLSKASTAIPWKESATSV